MGNPISYAIQALASALSGVIGWFIGRSQGYSNAKRDAKVEAQAAAIESYRVSQEKENEISAISNDDARRRLREWSGN